MIQMGSKVGFLPAWLGGSKRGGQMACEEWLHMGQVSSWFCISVFDCSHSSERHRPGSPEACFLSAVESMENNHIPLAPSIPNCHYFSHFPDLANSALMITYLSCHCFTKSLRRQPCDFMEYAAEVRLIFKPHLMGNGANSIGCMQQQIF